MGRHRLPWWRTRAARATAARILHGLLDSPQRRAPRRAAQAWSTVDGQGRARVVDAVFDAVRPPA
ncbi:hypothetical protein [Micromonospora zamorensis]|uniref:hypothetical protein n=1 Tax=Micromonospora zamorensis TaxID=709883 RepID=UPI002E294234|nr:hypothetical protein [Micromonospora zamorensis]